MLSSRVVSEWDRRIEEEKRYWARLREDRMKYTLYICDENLRQLPKAQLVFIADESAGPAHALTDSDIYQEGPSLDDVEAMGQFVKRMFPEGWTVINGEIVSSRLP